MDNSNGTKKGILIGIMVMFLGLLIFGAMSLGLNIKPEEKEQEVIQEEIKHEENKSTIKSDSPLRDETEIDAAHELKSVIIYYSLSGTTEKVAKYIKEKTGYELVKLETHKTYPKNDNEAMQLEIDNEKANFIYPKLKNDLHLAEYDVIYLGFPVWYEDFARPIYSFLEDYDLTGTIIVPFICSDNYGQGQMVTMLQRQEEGAVVINNPLTITNYNRDKYKDAVNNWLPMVKEDIENLDKF